MKTGNSLGNKKGRVLVSIWYLDDGENRVLSLESQEGLLTNTRRGEERNKFR